MNSSGIVIAVLLFFVGLFAGATVEHIHMSNTVISGVVPIGSSKFSCGRIVTYPGNSANATVERHLRKGEPDAPHLP